MAAVLRKRPTSWKMGHTSWQAWLHNSRKHCRSCIQLHASSDLVQLVSIARWQGRMHSCPQSSLDTSPVQAALVLGRMQPARKVTVDVGGTKEVEIPRDRPEPLTNMSAPVQQVRLGLVQCQSPGLLIRHVSLQACPQALAVRVCCCRVRHVRWSCVLVLGGSIMSSALPADGMLLHRSSSLPHAQPQALGQQSCSCCTILVASHEHCMSSVSTAQVSAAGVDGLGIAGSHPATLAWSACAIMLVVLGLPTPPCRLLQLLLVIPTAIAVLPSLTPLPCRCTATCWRL